jgi:putative Mg2+ transporter-C (MgtC) family protein
MVLWAFARDIFVALGLGVVIGFEREWRQHPAGLRTNALVSLGSALFVSLAMFVANENSPTRVAAQVVSGLGFLAGGVIFREGLTVRGLNTAATIWCSGAVGTLAGIGQPSAATIGTMAVLGVHLALRPVVNWIGARRHASPDREMIYSLRVECDADHDVSIRTILLRHVSGDARLRLQGLSTKDSESNRTIVTAEIFTLGQNDRLLEELVARVSIEPKVKAVSWQKAAA